MAEFVKDAYDYAANLIAGAAGPGNRRDEHLKRVFVVTSIDCSESRAEIRRRCPLEPDPRSQPVGRETSANVSEDLEGFFFLPAAVEDPGELDGGIGVPRFERQGRTKRLLIPPVRQHVRLGREKRIEK